MYFIVWNMMHVSIYMKLHLQYWLLLILDLLDYTMSSLISFLLKEVTRST